jgi:hypothetical protein
MLAQFGQVSNEDGCVNCWCDHGRHEHHLSGPAPGFAYVGRSVRAAAAALLLLAVTTWRLGLHRLRCQGRSPRLHRGPRACGGCRRCSRCRLPASLQRARPASRLRPESPRIAPHRPAPAGRGAGLRGYADLDAARDAVGAAGFEPATFRPPAGHHSVPMRPRASPASPTSRPWTGWNDQTQQSVPKRYHDPRSHELIRAPPRLRGDARAVERVRLVA